MKILIALFLTIILEFIIYAIAIRKNIGKLFLYSLLINSFTNPLANMLFKTPWFFPLEILVFIVEIPLIKYLFEIKWWKAIIISLIANLVTVLLSMFVFLFPIF